MRKFLALDWLPTLRTSSWLECGRMKADCRQASVSTKIMSEPHPARTRTTTALQLTILYRGHQWSSSNFRLFLFTFFPSCIFLPLGQECLMRRALQPKVPMPMITKVATQFTMLIFSEIGVLYWTYDHSDVHWRAGLTVKLLARFAVTWESSRTSYSPKSCGAFATLHLTKVSSVFRVAMGSMLSLADTPHVPSCGFHWQARELPVEHVS